MPGVYFAGGAGAALGAGEGDGGRRRRGVAGGRGARRGVAAAAAWGWAPGLIQQAWMRLSRRFRHLGVDLAAKAGQAAEGRLDMAAGAAEAVVEIEVAEGGIEVVPPHQAHHAAAEPDAFRVSGRAVDGLRRLDEFVGLALIVLGWRRPALAAGALPADPGGGGAALGERASRSDQEGQAGSGEVAQNRNSWIKHPSTHTFPD